MSFPPSDPGAPRWALAFAPSVASVPQKVRSRTQSLSSDRPSTVAHSLMSPPLSISPEAAFIASAAASQIVTNDHDAHAATWYDQQGVEPPAETVLVSRGALALVNSFLDHLLFNFLCSAGSTSLVSLRPAVTDVLKPKLASDAMNQADEELREYLGGADDEDYSQSARSARDWDLELVWKRTRLRCMVYSSLGDLEEEDEDFYMEQEDLVVAGESDDTVSPPVAIFLTSILEFMGEQALVVAGATASQRMRVDYEKGLKDGSRSPGDVVERIVVEDGDMERVALDRTLGRLWRSWKKKKMVRSPRGGQEAVFGGRPYSRGSVRASNSGNFRLGSITVDSPRSATEQFEPTHSQRSSMSKITRTPPASEQELAASIPLPMGQDDVTEILIPGLVRYDDDNDDDVNEVRHRSGASSRPTRPKSMMVFTSAPGGASLPTPADSQPHTPLASPRKRSNSMPSFATFTSMSPPLKRAKVASRPPADVPATGPEKRKSAGGKRPQATAKHVPVAGPPSPALSEETQSRAATIDPEQMQIYKGRRKSSAEISAMIAGATGGVKAALDAKFSRPSLDEVDEIDEFSEEPEILTSSRVSISGRSTSPTASVSDRGKPKPPITIGIPTRSPSVHSVRMIELHTPRSPVSRSRGSSADAQERASLRSNDLSRTDSFPTSPLREEKRPAGSPSKKAFPFPNGKPTRVHNDSISEAEEIAGMDFRQHSDATTPSASQSRSQSNDLQSQLHSSDAIFGSVSRQTSPPHSPVRSSPFRASPARYSPVNTAAVFSSKASNGTFFFDEKPDVPSKPSVSITRKAAPPALPERSINRPASAAGPSTPVEQRPVIATIRKVSGERPSPRPSPRASPRSSPPLEDVAESPRASKFPEQPGRSMDGSAPSVSSIQLSAQQQRRKPVRTSQESASGDNAVTPEDVARNFEELMKSDQTIQFTLTPESMRDIDSVRSVKVDSPVARPKSGKSEDVQPHLGDRTRSSPLSATPPRSGESRTQSGSQSTGLSSHPVHLSSGIKLTGPIPRAPPGVVSNIRVVGPQARDARVPRESLLDFADFIRGTGPSGAGPPVSLRTNHAGMMTMSGAAGGANDVNLAGAGSRPLTRSSTASSQNRRRYQARAAVVDPREDNSDLIDFIRRGPPSTGNNPRIPRTVAPFRTTMDSDQFAMAPGGKAVDATIPDIRNSSAASASVTERSSVNSSSALLNNKGSFPIPGSGQGGGGGMWDEDDMIPKRKQRRVRDPYAIDSDDEDEDLDVQSTPRVGMRHAQQQPTPPQEESLADFLMNAPAPKDTPVLPFHLPSGYPGVVAPSKPTAPKKKASAPSLMARFTRRESHSPTMNSFAAALGRSSSKTAVADSAPPQSAGRAGGGRGYTPIQINMPGDLGDLSSLYGTAPPTRPATGGPRVPMRKYEPRDPVLVRGRGATSDLADFLRQSEPPQDFAAAPRFGAVEQEVGGGGGFSKRFSRRK
ncbi:hypothetical protein, variant [Gaeumannomyces tritici R3-111a-1]|uniref:Flo11 n=1 Tax=Gaeumannomyces tritici (strain R3-111a-1) TaxID=644352 RepID=J3NYE5_GAET3|nr:hypothetical protein GGTG_06298 [Gaeumannomyces tritici R3-111a-1]XP_009222379.1 hypothetical protein, variant [Gaeumannomyces tritici R3-111a-1]EJT76378.1 hypothetical protein, variant [Gaeumannomyces tritici R3-111a-1]EJT76379.1 hypothetical protein GGTG_06298 [Gaeumannomyces tritici R3-111a-1]